MWLGRFLVRILSPLVRFILGVRVVGRENLPSKETPLVLCCNHISLLDPVFLLVAQPKRHIHFMAKAELFKNGLLTWFLGKQLGAFAVHRGTGDTDALATAKQLVRDGKIMGIFPEGTRSRAGELLRAKSGAAVVVAGTGATVQPVAIVCRGQHVRWPQRHLVVYGKPVTAEELHLDGDKPDLRYASRYMMTAIGDLIAQHRAEVDA